MKELRGERMLEFFWCCVNVLSFAILPLCKGSFAVFAVDKTWLAEIALENPRLHIGLGAMLTNNISSMITIALRCLVHSAISLVVPTSFLGHALPLVL